MALTENDLQQLLTETKKLACMNQNLKLEIQNTHNIKIDLESLYVLLENNSNFLKYFHDCIYEAIKEGYLRR